MARRRRRKKGGMPDAVVGTLLTVIGLVLIGALAGGAWWITHRPKPDALTNCPPTGSRVVNLVIFDQSDPVSPQQAQRIRYAMQQLRTAAEVGDAHSELATLGPTGGITELNGIQQRESQVSFQFSDHDLNWVEITAKDEG